MKNKKYIVFLTVEGVLLLLLSCFGYVKEETVFDLLALPLTLLADFLGKLSLSSEVGNAVSIVIYSAVCLVPVFVLLFRVKMKKFQKADSLLILVSAVLFAVVYLMINPTEMGIKGGFSGASGMLAVSFYSVLVGYFLLIFVNKIEKMNSQKTETILAVLLKITGAVFVAAVCFIAASEFLGGVEALKESGNSNFVTVFMLILKSKNAIFPNIFGVWVVLSALELLREMSCDRYSESTVKAAEKLSMVCMRAVRFCTFISILYNVLQLRFIAELPDVKFTLEIPLFSLGFILAVLVVSGYIKDSKALKEDNDSFI